MSLPEYLPRPVLVSRLERAQRRQPILVGLAFVGGMLVGGLLAVTAVSLGGAFSL